MSSKNTSGRSRSAASVRLREEKKAKLLTALKWEQRLLRAAFACGIIASLLFLVSFSSEYWVWVKFPSPQLRNDTGRPQLFYKNGHYHGLWKICRQEYHNFTVGVAGEDINYCRKMYFSLPDWILSTSDEKVIATEKSILDFRRSAVAVGIIALILSVFANVFVYFSLDQLRYIFKRLSGCLILITGASCWVTLEVFNQSVTFERTHMTSIMRDSEVVKGWSYNLVYFTLILFLFDGIVMLVCSRKRKGQRARSMKEAKENEPVYLGRI